MTAPRLLVVEDDVSLRDAIRAALVATGYVVQSAWDHDSALDAVATFRPDLVVLDVWLPGGHDGFDIAATIRDRVGTAAVVRHGR
jgi:DNA-binding response OmpR family regulator